MTEQQFIDHQRECFDNRPATPRTLRQTFPETYWRARHQDWYGPDAKEMSRRIGILLRS